MASKVVEADCGPWSGHGCSEVFNVFISLILTSFFVFVHQQAGDEIVLLKRIDDEWYIGRLGNQEGMFPIKFVEIIEDLPRETEPETKVMYF